MRKWISGLKSRRVIFSIRAVLVIGLLLLLYCWLIEPRRLVVVEETVVAPAEFSRDMLPLRIALLADLHVENTPGAKERLRQVVELVNSANPDLIVLLGDYMYGGPQYASSASQDEIVAILSDLSAPSGVYAVLGNHDIWWGREAMVRAFEKSPIRLLEDEYEILEFKGHSFALIGLADMTADETIKDSEQIRLRGERFRPVAEELPTIVLSHSPDVFFGLGAEYEVVLSGHTHGGQVRLPWIGPLIVPSSYGKKLSGGVYVEDDRVAVTSKGVGSSILRVRFMCPPEIVLLNFVKDPPEN